MNKSALKSIIFISFIIIYSINKPVSWPLDSAFARGDSSISISWTADSANTDPSWYIHFGNQCTGADSIYRHSDFIPGKTYKGVAYSYGGEDPWNLFRARIDSGYLVGSHLCHYREYGDPSDTITGTDCSGYLCYIWNVPRMSTSGLVQSSLFMTIDKTDLRAGDALVRGGYHCVFVAEADDPAETVVWEASSSVFGCRERVTDINTSYWEPFIALRYPEITGIFDNYNRGANLNSDLLSMKFLSMGRIKVTSLYGKKVFVRVYNILGQLIEQITLPTFSQNKEILSTKLLSKGIYLISLSIDNQIIFNKQVILYE